MKTGVEHEMLLLEKLLSQSRFRAFFQELTQVHRWPGNHKSSFLRFRVNILFLNLFLHQLAKNGCQIGTNRTAYRLKLFSSHLVIAY